MKTLDILGKPLVAFLRGFTLECTNHIHVFRAIMGLYPVIPLFWFVGALMPSLQMSALWSHFLFMPGLAAWRFLSLTVDELASVGLIVYHFCRSAIRHGRNQRPETKKRGD